MKGVKDNCVSGKQPQQQKTREDPIRSRTYCVVSEKVEKKWRKVIVDERKKRKEEIETRGDKTKNLRVSTGVNFFFFFARGSVFEIQRSFALEFLKLCFYSKTTKNERNKNNNIYERKKKKNFKTEIGDKERERERNAKSEVITRIKKKKNKEETERLRDGFDRRCFAEQSTYINVHKQTHKVRPDWQKKKKKTKNQEAI